MSRTFVWIAAASFLTLAIVANHPSHAQGRIKIDAKTPFSALLPKQPKGAENSMPVLLETFLPDAPEVMLHEPISSKIMDFEAAEQIADLIAKINQANKQKGDGFIQALRSHRDDLKGMPFRLGRDSRTSREEASAFKKVVDGLNNALDSCAGESFVQDFPKGKKVVLDELNETRRGPVPITMENLDRAAVGAAMQILETQSREHRVALARSVSEFPGEEAAKALARLAIFAPEEEVRWLAIMELKKRQPKHYTGVLMEGFRYPLPAVAQRAAYALAKLERKELVESLVKVLDDADPRMPVKKVVEGKEVYFVRELVRVNHHRNCLLCHAPGNTDDVPEGVLKVEVPLPTEALPAVYERKPPTRAGIVVRLDTTYLRQDFSTMIPVEHAHPWPLMQRFDFFVRSRELTRKMAEDWQRLLTKRTEREFSAYHRAAAYALRELTGQEAFEPTAEAWRDKLKLAAR